MTVAAPTIIHPLTRAAGAYPAQLDANFASIDSFCASVAADLAAFSSSTVAGVGNLSLLSLLLGTDSVVGVDSFSIAFYPDDATLVITGIGGGTSYCAIGGRLKQCAAETVDISAMAGNPAKRIIVGVDDLGGSEVALVVRQSDTEAEDDVDLLIWEFTLYVFSGGYTASGLRRRANVAPDLDAFGKALFQEIPVARFRAGTVTYDTNGVSTLDDCGVIVPWDCEIAGAYVRFGTDPGAGTSLNVTLRNGSTDLTAAATVDENTDGVAQWCAPLDPAARLAAGSFVVPYLAEETGDPSAAADITVTVILRRLFYEKK